MKRGRSTGNMTKPEAAWVDAIKRRGCLCCHERGYRVDPNGPALSEGSVPFERAFGDDHVLMEKQVALLNRGHGR